MTGPVRRPDPRRGAGADRAVPRLQGFGDPVGQTADTAARVDHDGDPAGDRRDRHRRDRPADSRSRHRPVVQRRDRAATAAGSDQGAGHRGRPRPWRQHVRRPAVRHERGARPGRGLRRRRPHPAAGAGAVSGCRAAGLAAGPAAQRRGAAHHGGAALRRRGQGAPDAVVLLRLPPARRGAQPGHQRRRQHSDVAVDDDQPAADLGSDGVRGAGDDADHLAAADAAHRGDRAAVPVGRPGRSRGVRNGCSWRNGPTPARLNAHIEETYSGFTVVKTFGHRAPRAGAVQRVQRRRLPGQLWGAVLFGPGRRRRRCSSATSAMSRSQWSVESRSRRVRSRSAASRRSSSTCASSISR